MRNQDFAKEGRGGLDQMSKNFCLKNILYRRRVDQPGATQEYRISESGNFFLFFYKNSQFNAAWITFARFWSHLQESNC